METTKNRFGKVRTLAEAMEHITDGITLMYGGFGGVGTSPLLIDAILRKNVRDLCLIGNDSGFPEIGIGRIICNGQAKRLITSHIGSNPTAGKLMQSGDLEVEFSPQGTLAERIRAGGAGIGAVLVDVGIGTSVAEGKPLYELNGKTYLVETPLTADVGIVYAAKADSFGNLVYRRSARNFNPLVAMASRLTIVHAEEIVEPGGLDPESVVTPGVFVDIIVTGSGGEWKWNWEQRN